MAASGIPFDGPKACPFVALELDRDRRSERPDYRHRCFAEPTPAPRSIAHQEAYCLSPGFSACPIFQDWALRAAARPVGAPDQSGPSAAAAAGLAVLGGAAAAGEPPIDDELPPLPPSPSAAADEPLTDPGRERAAEPLADDASAEEKWEPESEPERPYEPPGHAWDEPGEAQQLGAFDGPPPQSSLPGSLTAPEPEARSSWGQPDAGYQEPPELLERPGYVPPPARRDDPTPAPEEAAVPAFLAGRAASQPEPTAVSPSAPVDRVSREEIVPSWQIDSRYGAEPPDEPGDGRNRFDSILTAIAVIAILALGVAGVLFLPGLLAGGPGPARTAAPSTARPTGLPSDQPTLSASPAPTSAPQTAAPTDPAPTAQATPAAGSRTYRIRAGDTLFRIARRFDTSVDAILAANPEIGDANDIFAGQVIVIPPP